MKSKKEKNTRNYSRQLIRDLFIEVGGACAIPVCNESLAVDIAHIVAISDNGESNFENLIVLCKNHHFKYDSKKQKGFDRKTLYQLKDNLQVINGRYCAWEFRVLHWFAADDTHQVFEAFGRDLDLYYLINDGLLKELSIRLQNSINFPLKKYKLTKEGKEFIKRWKESSSLD